jgi:hypothetical protein
MSRKLTQTEREAVSDHLRRLESTTERLVALEKRKGESAAIAAEYARLVDAARAELLRAEHEDVKARALEDERRALRRSAKQVRDDLARERDAAAASDALANTNDIRLAGLYMEGNQP